MVSLIPSGAETVGRLFYARLLACIPINTFITLTFAFVLTGPFPGVHASLCVHYSLLRTY